MAVVVRETGSKASEKRPKRRSARRRKQSGLRKILVLASAMTVLLGYIGVYAQVTHTGYRRAELLTELRSERLENEALRVEIQQLTSPDRLASAAQMAGMLPGTEMNFISSPEPVAVASADGER